MDAQRLSMTRPTARRQPRLVLVRANAPIFYSTATASLLEALAPESAGRLLEFFSDDAALCAWIRNEWLPGKNARFVELRRYLEDVWPEFDWSSARETHRALVEQNGGSSPHRATAAREALARCVAAAQNGLFYRALACWSDDHRLRDLARAIAREEAQSFARFRRAFEQRAGAERVGLAASWRTARACVRSARDTAVRLAFDAVALHCPANAPFPIMDYSDLVPRVLAAVVHHASPRWFERVLFRPWQRAPRTPRPAAQPPSATWFKPVLTQAA